MKNDSQHNIGDSTLLQSCWRSIDKHHQIAIFDRNSKQFRNHVVKSVEAAFKKVEEELDLGKDTYFAIAEYTTPDSRKAGNVAGACAFWLDIDCGKDKAESEKGYLTKESAEDALKKFCKEAGIPDPTHIVDSGNGLHIYWVLNSLVTREKWQASAKQLKYLTHKLELKADDSRTADIASVLRIPGTLNYKYTPPKPVILKYASEESINLELMLNLIDNAYSKHCSASFTELVGLKKASRVVPPKNGNPDFAKLTSALTVLDPDCDEETWKLKRLAPLAKLALEYLNHANAICTLAKDWSSGNLRGKPSEAWTAISQNSGLTGKDAFEKEWVRFSSNNYEGRGTTIGTIYHDAKERGWCYSDKVSELDPLTVLQEHFCLISISGKICVSEREIKRGDTQKLSLSNRSDGALLLKRKVRELFPKVKASQIANEFFDNPNTVCYQGVEFNPLGASDDGCNPSSAQISNNF